ncbi:MAG: serine hydrolase domain-containing protein, partial [bacterium]
MYGKTRKNVLIRPVFLLLLIFTFCIASAYGQMTADQLRAYLERVRVETGAPGISVAIAQHGKMILSVGVGYAELENLTPATGSTVHNIASISKTHAAVAVMQLVEQGKVNLDERIQKYVPYFPEKRWPITVRHILTHTSGIRHYKRGEFGEQRIKEKMHYDKFEDAIGIWKDDPLLFKPGEFWSYSSHASNLMHGIIETVTGMGFEEYMKKYVWEPAGMLSTEFDVPD